jgi:hypothetical protein
MVYSDKVKSQLVVYHAVGCDSIVSVQPSYLILVATMSAVDASQYALPSVPIMPGHGSRATGVGADFLINTTLAAGNLSRVGIAIGALPSTGHSSFTRELCELEEALAKLSQIAQTVGVQAAQLHQRVKDAAAQQNAC